jgi:phage terminase large subunit-like protein
MAFWWNEKNESSNKVIPSLNSGATNYRKTEVNKSIFTTEDFKNISSMFDADELKIASYKSQNRSNLEIAEILNIPVSKVDDEVNLMIDMYNKVYRKNQNTLSYCTITSKRGR